LRELEASLPPLEEISEREVREYYDAHRSEFKEPERRRVLMIRVGSAERAQTVLEQAKGVSGQKWGKLADEYALDRHNLGEEGAPELAGDVGFVSAPKEKRGENDAVPDAVRQAIFELDKVGDVAPSAVEEGSFFYVVRLGGISPARDRSVTEADRAIRVELRRRKFIEAEKKLEADLRKKYPVAIDEQAIQSYRGKAPTKNSPEKAPSP
jgi:parvulin-like peptidyl-prolyl isomerase